MIADTEQKPKLNVQILSSAANDDDDDVQGLNSTHNDKFKLR
jgi:hypothetical protein